PLRGMFSEITQRAADFGEALTKIFRGRFKEGFDQMGDSVRGVGRAMIETGKRAQDLERRSQNLIIAQRELTVVEAELLKTRDEIREQSRQEGVTIEERTKLMQRAS